MNPAGNPWPPIGKLFVDRGRVTPGEFEDALAEQARTGERIGEILVRRGRITRIELADALSTQWSWNSTARQAPCDTAERSVAPALRVGLREADERLAAGEARLATLERNVAELSKACVALLARLEAHTRAIEDLRRVTAEQAKIAVAGSGLPAEPRPTAVPPTPASEPKPAPISGEVEVVDRSLRVPSVRATPPTPMESTSWMHAASTASSVPDLQQSE